MRTIIYFLFFLFLFKCMAYGQPETKMMLDTGEMIPDYSFNICTDNKIEQVRLSNYKGEMILFDFWGIDCAVCISSMPYMLDLQTRFKGKLRIFLVTRNSDKEIRELLEGKTERLSQKIIQAGQQLSFITSDTILSKVFPHTVNPLHVIIDANRIFRAIAFAGTSTVQNIQNFLMGKPVRWANYYFPDIDSRNLDTWVSKRIGFENHLLQYSFFTKRDKKAYVGLKYVKEVDPGTKKITRLNFINYSIEHLYRAAYYGNPMNRDIIVIESADTNRFYFPRETSAVSEWLDNNSFCYAIKIPNAQEDIFSFMKTDLDKFFKLDSKMERRIIKCLVLKRLPAKADKLKTKGGSPDSNTTFDKDNSGSLKVVNMPMNYFFERIREDYIYSRNIRVSFLNETDYRANIDIDIPWAQDNYSISSLKKSLQERGLDIVEEYKEMEVLVLRDKKASEATNKDFSAIPRSPQNIQ